MDFGLNIIWDLVALGFALGQLLRAATGKRANVWIAVAILAYESSWLWLG